MESEVLGRAERRGGGLLNLNWREAWVVSRQRSLSMLAILFIEYRFSGIALDIRIGRPRISLLLRGGGISAIRISNTRWGMRFSHAKRTSRWLFNVHASIVQSFESARTIKLHASYTASSTDESPSEWVFRFYDFGAVGRTIESKPQGMMEERERRNPRERAWGPTGGLPGWDERYAIVR